MTGVVAAEAGELEAKLASFVRAAPPVVEAPAGEARTVPVAARSYIRPGFGGRILRLEWRDESLTFTTPEMAAWHVTLGLASEPGAGLPGETVSSSAWPTAA